MSFASNARELRRGDLSMLETHIIMSSLIFCLVLSLVLHLTHLLVLCLISLMDLTIAHIVLVYERTTLCLDAFITVHILIVVIVSHIGMVFCWRVNEDMPSIHSSSNETPLDIAGPITRSRAKQLQKEIHSQVNANLMFNNRSMLNEPMLLSSCFNVLRNDGVYEPAWDQDGFKHLDI
jgi:hypothetical protein